MKELSWEIKLLLRFILEQCEIEMTPIISIIHLIAGPPRFGPCLDFGFQYALIRNNRSKNFGVEYWALPGSNSPKCEPKFWRQKLVF